MIQNAKKYELENACKKASEAIEKMIVALNQLKGNKKFIHESKYHK